MAIIRGDSSANTIAATGPGDTIFGLSGFDNLSSTYERADLRGGWGQDQLRVDFNYTISDVGPYPDMRWSLSGDQGNDTLSVNAAISTDWSIIGGNSLNSIVADVVLDGGAGNDTINVDVSVEVTGYVVSLPYGPVVNTAVVDLEGNNTVNISSYNEAWDMAPEINTTVILGDGNDDVNINGLTEAYNFIGVAYYDLDVGDGNNKVTVSDVGGSSTLTLRSGSGIDIVELDYFIDPANSQYTETIVDVDLGAGDDSLTLNFDTFASWYTGVDVSINLGDGDNNVSISGIGSYYEGVLINQMDVVSGSGNDTFNINMDGSAFLDSGSSSNQGILIDSGDGSDIIALSGALWNISAGAGNDTITAGSGSDTISMGAGADVLSIDRNVFVVGSSATQRLTVTDFTLAEGDAVSLTTWNIPALGAMAVIDDAGDLQALKTPGGDVISFVQVGADALLTLDIGGGNSAEILFQNLDISSPPAPVTDPKVNLSGTNADDVLVGGNNDDKLFLRRGDDIATGGDGADTFRFNFVDAHNRNGDNHTITDLDFLEGDELHFHNFGPTWADDALDPSNALTYVPGSYNTWIADSVADLRELRDSGAFSATLLAGGMGTQIAYTDQGGDHVTVDLWGIFV